MYSECHGFSSYNRSSAHGEVVSIGSEQTYRGGGHGAAYNI